MVPTFGSDQNKENKKSCWMISKCRGRIRKVVGS